MQLEIRTGRIINVLCERDRTERFLTGFCISFGNAVNTAVCLIASRLVEQKLELCVSWEKPTLLKESGVE